MGSTKPTAPKMTEAQVVERIRRRYCRDSGNGPAAVCLPQVRNAAGFDASRTADALVMGLWPSRGLHLEGFEVKCSRADVLKELRDPSKAEAFAQYCERWWLVLAEKSHIKDGELPEPWGLLVVSGENLREIKPAPVRDVPKSLPKSMLAAMLRQADREAQRPGKAELEDAYRRGIEAGKASADRDARNAVELRERVEQFAELTGIDLQSRATNVELNAKAVRLLTGGG